MAQTSTAPAAGASVGSGERDDLTEIKGIGPATEKRLVAAGITSFRQIAAWSDAEVEALEGKAPGLRSSLHRYDWIGQAKRLAGRREGPG